jgi:hypothetical protein
MVSGTTRSSRSLPDRTASRNAYSVPGPNTIGAIHPTLSGFPFAFPTAPDGTPDTTWMNEVAAYYYEMQIESYNNPQIRVVS